MALDRPRPKLNKAGGIFKTLEHIRIQAVRRVIEDKEEPSEAMKSYGLCRTSIYPWLREFKEQGWAALAESIA